MLPSRLTLLATVGQRAAPRRERSRAAWSQVGDRLARGAHERPDLVLRAPASPPSASSRTDAFISSRLRANGRRSSNVGPSTAAKLDDLVERVARLGERPGQQATARCTFGSCSAIAPSAPFEDATSWVEVVRRTGRPGVVSTLKLWIRLARFVLALGDLAVELREVAVDRPEAAEQLAEVLVAARRAPCRRRRAAASGRPGVSESSAARISSRLTSGAVLATGIVSPSSYSPADCAARVELEEHVLEAGRRAHQDRRVLVDRQELAVDRRR